MELRKLGDSVSPSSRIGLGCNNFGRRVGLAGTRAVVNAALEAGITVLDTAERYGEGQGDSERFLGEVLRGRRERVVTATKFGGDPRAVLLAAQRTTSGRRSAWALGGHSKHPYVLHWNGNGWSEIHRGLADVPTA